MKNWTDKIINWHQLPGTEVRRLLDTWGMTERQIANYDARHGYEHTALAVPAPARPHVSNTKNPVDFPAPVAKKPAAKKTVARAPVRQKHSGADGEIKFVEHRGLYIGFWGGRVVVTKRTAEQCQEFLSSTYGAD